VRAADGACCAIFLYLLRAKLIKFAENLIYISFMRSKSKIFVSFRRYFLMIVSNRLLCNTAAIQLALENENKDILFSLLYLFLEKHDTSNTQAHARARISLINILREKYLLDIDYRL